ncbi:MAG: hypothetical protein ABI593_04375 [Betaproteobacteria bacterium]
MAHEASVTINSVHIEYARTFCRAGFVILVYDHRSFGLIAGSSAA